ncbi:MAG: hypothetical protein V4538_17350 [Bacteroidota bacterium]
MDKKIYTKEEYDNATSFIGKKVWYFLKMPLPQVTDAQAYTVHPQVSVKLGSTTITGVKADVKKISNGDGTIDEYTGLNFILKNPYYIKPDEPEEGAMGFPESTVNSWKEWNFAYLTLNQWFFETKEKALESIGESTSMYYDYLKK